MTIFFFFQHKINELVIGQEKKETATITRGGKGLTLLNPSYFEADTTYRRFNEIFLILKDPALEHIFQKGTAAARRLIPKLGFLVDNGPGEAPSSPLVQILLVRLLKYLDLDVVAQLSYAEYHSKLNPVERVHAVENECIGRHGPFNSR